MRFTAHCDSQPRAFSGQVRLSGNFNIDHVQPIFNRPIIWKPSTKPPFQKYLSSDPKTAASNLRSVTSLEAAQVAPTEAVLISSRRSNLAE
jgi:hypothetical protein